MATLRRVALVCVLLGIASPLFAQSQREDTPARDGILLAPTGWKRCDTAAVSSGTDGDLTIPCVLSTGNVPVTVSNTLATDVTEDAASSNAVTGPTPLEVRRDAAVSSADTSGDYATKNQDANGLSWTRLYDPCTALPKTTAPISQTVDTVVIAAVSAKKNYICAITVVASAAEIVSVTEGTGSTCGTSEVALFGSTTDANGASFAANGGFSLGTGLGTVINGITTNVDTCVNVSGSNRISGMVTYVQAP